MEGILDKLGLSNLCVRFTEEKITPNLVCKLSKYEMLTLGVISSTDIMKLRLECLKYGPPIHNQSNSFKVHYEISKDILEYLIESNITVSDIAKMLSVSERTIYRRMSKYGIQSRSFTDIDDDSLDEHLEALLMQFPRCGEKMLKELLVTTNGIKVTRSKIRCALLRIDSDGIQERKRGRLHRRVYCVPAPNHLWHIDTNHKLIRWNFVIAGGIDGFSRFVVFLSCVDNNRSDTIFSCFKSGVELYGTPLRVRSDQGLENLKVAEYMLAHRSNSSMLVGKSTHNQRIERLWRDIFEGVLSFFYDLFYYLEEQNLLDPLNEAHLFALHYVYEHKINSNLAIWREAWNKHKIRTLNATPTALFTAGTFTTPTPSVDMHDDLPDGFDYAAEQQQDQRPVLSSLGYEISEGCEHRLVTECPRDMESQEFGIDLYENAVRILMEEMN